MNASRSNNPKLWISTQSWGIVHAVFVTSHRRDVPLGLCASTNQFNARGGYVGLTRELMTACGLLHERYPKADVTVMRDHLAKAPAIEDALRTVSDDVNAGIRHFHIDGRYALENDDALDNYQWVAYSIANAARVKDARCTFEIGPGEMTTRLTEAKARVVIEAATSIDGCTSVALPSGAYVYNAKRVVPDDPSTTYAGFEREVADFNVVEHNGDWDESQGRDLFVFDEVKIGPCVSARQSLSLYDKMNNRDRDAWLYRVVRDKSLWSRWCDEDELDRTKLAVAGHYTYRELFIAGVADERSVHDELSRIIEHYAGLNDDETVGSRDAC